MPAQLANFGIKLPFYIAFLFGEWITYKLQQEGQGALVSDRPVVEKRLFNSSKKAAASEQRITKSSYKSILK